MKRFIWIDEARKMTKKQFNEIKFSATGGLLNSRGVPVLWQFDKGSGKNSLHKKQIELLNSKDRQLQIINTPYGESPIYKYYKNYLKQKEENMFDNPLVSYSWGNTKKEWKDVTITKVHNGFIIKVGCVTFVETSWDKICKALKEYWDNPEKAEKKYYKK